MNPSFEMVQPLVAKIGTGPMGESTLVVALGAGSLPSTSSSHALQPSAGRVSEATRERQRKGERIGVCMWYDEGAEEQGSMAADVNLALANAEGFDFVRDRRTYYQDRAPSWQKLGLLYDELASGRHDVVLWVDADAVFLPGGGARLRKLLRTHSTADIIFGSNDPFSAALNMGVVAFRATSNARRFLRAVIDGKLPEALAEHDTAPYHLVELRGKVEKVMVHNSSQLFAMQAWPSPPPPAPAPPPPPPEKDGALWDMTSANDMHVSNVFENVSTLCSAYANARQWEQGCIQAMLTMNAFREPERLSYVIEPQLQVMPINVSILNQTAMWATCPYSIHNLSQIASRNDATPMIHFAACPPYQRNHALQWMRALHHHQLEDGTG